MERSSWDLERAELQARIAFLQGERKGQDNLKNDLIRRIKMLEYALKQERYSLKSLSGFNCFRFYGNHYSSLFSRAKFHKLKYGTDLSGEPNKPPDLDPEPAELKTAATGEDPVTSQVSWRQGRQLLRQYLQEIGYTDTIIDVRSNRVRSLLGLEGPEQAPLQENGANDKRVVEVPRRAPPTQKKVPVGILICDFNNLSWAKLFISVCSLWRRQ